MTAVEGFLLAGGRSSRMGRDKALLELDGLVFAERIARSLDAAGCGPGRVVGRDSVGRLDGVPDLRPGAGPLAGIEAALSRCDRAGALIVACDMPFVTPELFGRLVVAAGAAPGRIVVPVDVDGRVAPLCGIYPRAALPAASHLLDAGERRPRRLLERFPTRLLEYADYADLPGAERLLRNVNTPEEYAALLEG